MAHLFNGIDSRQLSVQSDGFLDNPWSRFNAQGPRLLTEAEKVPSIITTPTPTSLLSDNNTELSLPLCKSRADFKQTHGKTTWKATNTRNLFSFIDFVTGVTCPSLVLADR
jgi:hypothetical protein